MDMTILEEWLPSRVREGFPVMPGYFPGIGHVPTLHKDAVRTFRRARAAVGPVFWVSLGFGTRYLFCTGKGSFDLLRDGRLATSGSRDSLAYILGHSLLTLDGAEHRRVRGAMNATFSPRGLVESGAGHCVKEVVEACARRWSASDRLIVHDEMKEMTLDVVFRIAGVGRLDLPAWRAKYNEVLLGLWPPPWDLPLTPRRRALRATRWVNAEIEKIIERARAEATGESVTHALVRARDEAGQPLSNADLVDNIRLLFLAGHETTATTTAWAILELCRRPELWDRLVDEATAGAGVPVSLAEAKAFPFCEAVFRESVRLYGPAWFIERRTLEPIEHEGRAIPKDVCIGVVPSFWNRDEAQYPNPDAFEPERWLDRPAPTPIEISQFGVGAHFCLGYHLAWLEVVAFLVALGRTMGAAKKRPWLVSKGALEPRYFPLPRPPANAAVRFV